MNRFRQLNQTLNFLMGHKHILSHSKLLGLESLPLFPFSDSILAYKTLVFMNTVLIEQTAPTGGERLRRGGRRGSAPADREL